jgi:hypothetical protein
MYISWPAGSAQNLSRAVFRRGADMSHCRAINGVFPGRGSRTNFQHSPRLFAPLHRRRLLHGRVNRRAAVADFSSSTNLTLMESCPFGLSGPL